MGEVFLDGSASNPRRPELSASACSIVGMEMRHDMQRMELRLDVALDHGLDGSEAAEISAVEFLLRNCVLPLTAWSDCQNVVDTFEHGRAHATSPEHAFCVYWRRVFALLDDHACPGGLCIRKIKAHSTASNFGDYGMSYLQWAGNRNADQGALTTAQAMAEELNLKGWAVEYDEIEADHRGLCIWIAMITAHVNNDTTRDAIPLPDDVGNTAKNKIHGNRFRGSALKRIRINVPDAVRMFGDAECKDIADLPTHGTYACLEDSNKRYRLNSKTTREVAATQGFDDTEYPQMAFDWSFEAGETLEEMLTDVMNDAEEQPPPDVEMEVQPPAEQVADPPGHGGLLLQTSNIVWCVRCGGSAQLGATSKHLRKRCNGKPENASMRQRRNRLVRGCHPTTCAPLHAAARRVTVL